MRDYPKSLAAAVYKSDYWDAIKADELPEAVRYPVFDAAVNSGPAQAVKWLQRALNVADDGKVGPQTINAARAADGDALARRMIGMRLQFMTSLRHWDAFGRGWARRIADVLIA
jgi:lysozyme family protein